MAKNGSLFLTSFFFAGLCYAQPLLHSGVTNGDSATLAASHKYSNPSFFKRLFLGKNYRTAWAAPVTLPVFKMREMGFTIKELGGGQQTKSLRLLDKSGHEWALRTIDKDVKGALPLRLQGTLAQKVVQDMVSAAHPYAPLTIPVLAQAAGIVAATPVFYFVPDDPAFGEYRDLFKNTMCMLENREPAPDKSDTKNTENMVEDLLEDNTTQVNEAAVLQARLLDMLIGDWDRHQDQWRWGFEKKAGTKYGYAIPRDRDQAYFQSGGLLVKIARAISLKHLVGFAKNTSKLKKLNAKSWNFDCTFLKGLDAADWEQGLQSFTSAITDSVIYEAVKKLPQEVYPLHGSLIEKKLIARRNSLPKDALRYYRFISSAVTITGTDAPERFVINTTRDSITIQQFAGTDLSKLVYKRAFHRSETYQVNLIGLGGADEFVQQATGRPSRMRLYIDGGKGANKYQMKATRRTTFFDSGMDAKAYKDVLKKELRINE
jgi:hypothetical protein